MRAYQAQHYSANRERRLETVKLYKQNNPKEHKDSAARYREKNAEKLKIAKREYYKQNRERLIERVRISKREKPERERAYNKKYRAKDENKEKTRASVQRRYARKRDADCGCVTAETRPLVTNLNNGKCAYCPDGLAEAFEHVVALDNGGKNCLANGLPSCRKCNSSKGTKELDKWLQETGRTMQYTGPMLTCPKS